VTRTCHGLPSCNRIHMPILSDLHYPLLSPLSHTPLSCVLLFSYALFSSQPRRPSARHKSMFKIHPIWFLKDAFKCYLARGPNFEWQLPIVAKPFDFGAIMGINISESSVFVFSGPLKCTLANSGLRCLLLLLKRYKEIPIC